MNLEWRFEKEIPAGGTVLSVAGLNGKLWVASSSGLFHSQNGTWKPVVLGIPFVHVNVVTEISGYLFVAGVPVGIIRSTNQGDSWQSCYVDQIHTPVSCIQPSPNFERDGVILAGTTGDGVLRSTDAGRSWVLSNFGLRNFSIFSFASAPEWERRQFIFAGTDQGVFQSPNGGRAWRFAGLHGHSVISLGVSPEFHQDGMLLAGTSSDGVFKSTDGGKTWVNIGNDYINDVGVNSIHFDHDGRLWIGTAEGEIFLSQDRGESLQLKYQAPNSVLTLETIAESIYAGLQDEGLYQSEGDGHQWGKVSGLKARRVNWLRETTTHQLAIGVYEGIWVSSRTEIDFKRIGLSQDLSLITDATSSDKLVFLSGPEGILAADPGAATYTKILDTDEAILALNAIESKIWAGGEFGSLWSRFQEVGDWGQETTPFGGKFPINTILSTSGEDEVPTLVAAIGTSKGSIVRVMRSQDGGSNWDLWWEARGDWRKLRISAEGSNAERILTALGTTCYWRETGAWKKAELTDPQSPITAVLVVPKTSLMLVGSAYGIMLKKGEDEWRQINQGLEGEVIVDLRVSMDFSNDQRIYALTLDGRLYSLLL